MSKMRSKKMLEIQAAVVPARPAPQVLLGILAVAVPLAAAISQLIGVVVGS